MAFSLAGCGDQSGGDAGDRPNRMYTWLSNESDRQQWEAFVEGVKQSGDAEFNLQLEGPTFQEYWTLVKTRMSANDAPCIITTQAARAQEMSSLLAPLDELAEEEGIDLSSYNQAMMQGLTVDGKVRAIPYDAEPMLLYYNKEAFKAAGLKEPGADYTREQFLSDAKALTKDSNYGVYVSPLLLYPYLTMAFADGNRPVVDGELKLTDEGFVNDVQFGMDLVAKEKVAAAPNPGDNDENGRAQFFAGKVAMIIDGPWFYATIKEGASFDVGIAAPPSSDGSGTGLIQGSGFGIAQSCPDKKAAFKNIVKMTTPEVVGHVGKTRGTVPSLEAGMDAWAEGKEPEDVEVVKSLLANGLPLETTVNWNQVETQFGQYSSEGTRGVKSAKEILESIDKGIG